MPGAPPPAAPGPPGAPRAGRTAAAGDAGGGPAGPGATVVWTALGADGPALVRACGRLYERRVATRDRRSPLGLVPRYRPVPEDAGPAFTEWTSRVGPATYAAAAAGLPVAN